MPRSPVALLDDDIEVVVPPAAALDEVAPAPPDAPEVEPELAEPHAAMNAASPVAAAAPPMVRPAIFRKRLRSTSSRASCSTTPGPAGRVGTSSLMGSVIGCPHSLVSGPVVRWSHPATTRHRRRQITTPQN